MRGEGLALRGELRANPNSQAPVWFGLQPKLIPRTQSLLTKLSGVVKGRPEIRLRSQAMGVSVCL